MCLPWLGFSIVKRRLGNRVGYLSLLAFWICFEYIHLQDWGLSWPWLTLGNVFAAHPQWVQWYEYSGVSGGTLWVMAVNIFLFEHVRQNILRQEERKSYKNLASGVVLIAAPVLVSMAMGMQLHKKGLDTANIVVVQPNIDPYEKVSSATGSFEAQLGKLIVTSEKEIDEQTRLVVWPETALFLPNGLEEDKMRENFLLNPLWAFLKRHPQLRLFTGVESYHVYDAAGKSKTAKEIPGSSFYYDSYNAAVLLDSTGPLQFYHKSRLVPGVETLPWFLKFLGPLFEKFGGTTAGYARQPDRNPVVDSVNGYKIAPSICYESIYGEFTSRYFRNGANLLCIITNDGWWGNTSGHKQHMAYAKLRAIENRTWVLRSANTGISAVIDPYGNVHGSLGWGKNAAIKTSLAVPGKSKTFYAKYGDLLSKLMVTASLLFIVYLAGRRLMRVLFKKKFPGLQQS